MSGCILTSTLFSLLLPLSVASSDELSRLGPITDLSRSEREVVEMDVKRDDGLAANRTLSPCRRRSFKYARLRGETSVLHIVGELGRDGEVSSLTVGLVNLDTPRGFESTPVGSLRALKVDIRCRFCITGFVFILNIELLIEFFFARASLVVERLFEVIVRQDF